MNSRYFLLLLFILTCLRLSIFYISPVEDKTKELELNLNSFKSQPIEAVVCREPKYYFNKQEVVLCLEDNLYFLAIFETWPKIELFDEISLRCALKKPKNYSDFNYVEYLKKQDIYYLCLYPLIKEIEPYQGSSWPYKLWQFKQIISRKINRNLQEPASGLLKATLLGLKTELSLDLKDSLGRLGLAHLLSISGLHIGLLVYGLNLILKKIRLQKISKPIVITFLFFYLFLIAFPVSAIRSSLMIVFIFLFKQGSVKKRFYLAFLFMLLVKPTWIEEVGFQLSFLAVFALIYLLPKLDGYFWQFLNKAVRYLKKKKVVKLSFRLSKIHDSIIFREIIRIALASIAVNILIWPILIYNFQSFNYLFFIYNILVLPVLPLFLSLGILAIALPLGVWGFLAVHLITEYLVLVSQFELGYFEAKLSVSFLIIYYLVLGYYIFYRKRIN